MPLCMHNQRNQRMQQLTQLPHARRRAKGSQVLLDGPSAAGAWRAADGGRAGHELQGLPKLPEYMQVRGRGRAEGRGAGYWLGLCHVAAGSAQGFAHTMQISLCALLHRWVRGKLPPLCLWRPARGPPPLPWAAQLCGSSGQPPRGAASRRGDGRPAKMGSSR